MIKKTIDLLEPNKTITEEERYKFANAAYIWEKFPTLWELYVVSKTNHLMYLVVLIVSILLEIEFLLKD